MKRPTVFPRRGLNWEKMDGDVPEIDVKEPRALTVENPDERLEFTPGNLPGRPADLLEPESSREMQRRLANHRDFC